MLTFPEIIIASISEIIFPGFREVIIGNMIENIATILKNISWHILSRRETPMLYIYIYSIPIYIYIFYTYIYIYVYIYICIDAYTI